MSESPIESIPGGPGRNPIENPARTFELQDPEIVPAPLSVTGNAPAHRTGHGTGQAPAHASDRPRGQTPSPAAAHAQPHLPAHVPARSDARLPIPARSAALAPAPEPLSLIRLVAAGKLSIPRKYPEQKAFFRFLRRASKDQNLVEQVYRFRDSVLLSAMEGKPDGKGMTVGIAGVRGGEGTSILSLLLALSLGECSNRRVAFLDGRLSSHRFDMLAKLLNLSKNSVSITKGYSEICGFYNEAQTNVYFLQNTSEERSLQFFSDKALGGFLRELQGHFDFTILDLPPLLRDTVSLFTLPHLDRLFLSVAAGTTSLSEVDRCFEVAERGGATVSGVIINKQRAPWWSRFAWRDYFF